MPLQIRGIIKMIELRGKLSDTLDYFIKEETALKATKELDTLFSRMNKIAARKPGEKP